MSSARRPRHTSLVVRPLKKYAKISLRTAKKLAAISPSGSTTPHYSTGENENTIINRPHLVKSKIIFHGKNNILFCEEELTLIKSEIHFHGDNGVLYLSRNKAKRYHASFFISHNSAVFIGRDTRFNMGKSVDIHAADHKHIIIGDDCLFSWNPWIFTSDAHPVYDSVTGQRINQGRSVLIGDHVWIGKEVSILKGSVIGSGAIIGADSILSGKVYNSNSSYIGSPARELRKNVFFTKHSIKNSNSKDLEHINEYQKEDFIYSYHQDEQLTIDDIDRNLDNAKTSEAKLAWIEQNLVNNKSKNRFYVSIDP